MIPGETPTKKDLREIVGLGVALIVIVGLAWLVGVAL